MAISTMPIANGSKTLQTHDSHGPPRKKHRASTSNTMEGDMTVISDLFELQVDEFLKDLEQQAKANVQKVTALLKKLRDTIAGLPSQKPLPPREAESHLKKTSGICTPFASPPPKDAKYTLEFTKPSTINVVGSTASETLLARDGRIIADMVVIMPSEIFQEKDYRKHRYFYKKAYYTACLAAGLRNVHLEDLSLSFSMQNGNPLQPCILIQQQGNEMTIIVRIICVAPLTAFPEDKLLPWVNNLPENPAVSKTPFYNSTLRSELLTLKYLGLIHKANNESSSLRKATLLFSIWLRQRGLGTDLLQGGFGTFEAQTLMAMLLDSSSAKGMQAVFRTRYDPIQLFKATLILLSTRDFVSSPTLYNYTMNNNSQQGISQPLQNTNYDIIDGSSACFFDGPRLHNLLFKTSAWSMARLRRQAEITVKCLSGSDSNRFEHCFLSKLDNSMIRYDLVLRVDLDQFLEWAKTNGESAEAHFSFSNHLYRTLKQALGDRVREISFGFDKNMPWDIKRIMPKLNKSFRINIVLDAQQATRLQDLGPSADDKEAAATFRKFWGAKAELRRFKDGSIQETVIWNDQITEPITTQIIRYALSRHHNDGKSISIQELGSSFWERTMQPKQSQALTPFEDILKTFQNLEKTTRELKMPLDIRQISPVSPGLRYTMLNIDAARGSQPLQVIVQFESSGQWPDDLRAIQQVKIAFLQKLGDLLNEQESSMQAKVGLGQANNNPFCRPFLEVTSGTYCFNIVIYHDRELVLLKSSLAGTTEERRITLPEILYHNQMFLRTPLHTQRVKDLCTQYPLLSQSIRLFKAWCASHLLLPHFREETLELFVIYSFTQPSPYGVPSSLRTAFLRTISMLAKWDWHNTPLFVPFNDDTENNKIIQDLDTHFHAWRKVDPSFSRVALIIGSTLDPTGTAWTEQTPSKMIAARLTSLAKITYSAIIKHDLTLDSRLLFTHSYKDYEFILHLNTTIDNLPSAKVQSAIQSYIHELDHVFGEIVVWFYSSENTSLIAGLWNPLVQSKKWKVNLGYSSVPVVDGTTGGSDFEAGDTAVRCNAHAMINEMVRLGGDLVARVVMKGEET